MRRAAGTCLLGALSACTPSVGALRDEEPEASAPADASDSAADDASDAAPDGPCSAPPERRPDGGTCVIEATGSVTDLAGAPLPNLVVTFCGAICFGTRTDDAGAFTIAVGTFLPTENFALHADGRPDHAVDYFRLGHAAPQVVTHSMHLPPLPASAVLLPPDGSPASNVTVGDLTLSIPGGTKFDLDIEDYGNGSAGRTLRAAAVPLASAPPYATDASVDAIWALAPSGAKASAKMGVTLANTAGLAASAAVDVMVLGDDYSSIPPTVGVLSVVAAAHVSADGKTIATDTGEGISELTWLAVRRKGK